MYLQIVIMELEAWIANFDEESWKSLRIVYGGLPQGLQESLRCVVNGTSLPLGLVLQETRPRGQQLAVLPAVCEVPRCVVTIPTQPPLEAPVEDVVAPMEIQSPDVQRQDPEVPRGKICDVCGERPPHLRRHVEQYHLPYWLHGDAACFSCRDVFPTAAARVQHQSEEGEHRGVDGEDQTTYATWVLSMKSLMEGMGRILGVTHVDGLVSRFVREGWCPPRTSGVQFNLSMQLMLMDVAKITNAPCPARYLDCTQPQHSIELMHWRTLLNFLAAQSGEVQQRIHDWPVSSEATNITLQLLGAPRASDSHCHLATYCHQVGKPVPEALSDAAAAMHCGPQRRVNAPLLWSIVDNRVFPQEWDLPASGGTHLVELPGGPAASVDIMCSFGSHPKERVVDWRRLEQLIRRPDCVAVGECGLDHTVKDNRRQEVNFKRQLVLALKYQKPVVLHLRPEGRNCQTVLSQALHLLASSGVSRSHKIHIHSFTGSFNDYRHWVAKYPNTIFGVSRATLRASEEFLRLADLKRIVLETDAPFMDRRRRAETSPYDLMEQADRIAATRGLPTRVVVQAACLTATVFYQG